MFNESPFRRGVGEVDLPPRVSYACNICRVVFYAGPTRPSHFTRRRADKKNRTPRPATGEARRVSASIHGTAIKLTTSGESVTSAALP